jgi:Brp/Blh family beta-carotene 15,15'-monooxygenase
LQSARNTFALGLNLRAAVLLIGITLACAHALGSVPALVDYLFFGVFLITLGIPHGAVDHIVAKQVAESNQRTFSLARFLAQYMLQIVLYAALWYLFPAMSLLLFILLSAWHFGESDVQPAPRHLAWKTAQFILGSFVLFFILMRQPDLTGAVIQSITQENTHASAAWSWLSVNALVVYGVLLAALGCAVAWAHTQAPIALPLKRWGYFIVLLGVINFLPLLPAFALYFGGWHALNTFHHMANFMGHTSGISKLWKAALPFTLLAFVFLLLTGVVWFTTLANHDPIPVLFIFIALITLPHLVVMHKMFREF